jgi:hypothetical protein
LLVAVVGAADVKEAGDEVSGLEVAGLKVSGLDLDAAVAALLMITNVHS